jgi:hypothetical protein
MKHFSRLNFANVKRERVQKYMTFLASAAIQLQKKGVKLPHKEDPRLVEIKKSEERFEQNVQTRIDVIEQRISKTLYRLNKRLVEERQALLNQIAVLKSAQAQPKAMKSSLPGVPPLLPKSSTEHQQFLQRKLQSVDHASERLAEVLHLRQKVRVLEEKLFWLQKRGLSSPEVTLLEKRLMQIKDVLYSKIFLFLDAVHKTH